jgi:hypothetical protein
MLIVLAKAHVKGYVKQDGTVVRPHDDKRPAAKPVQPSLELREPTGGDQVTPFPYASGMSRRRDMEAAIESPAGLGTEIGELSNFGMDRIVEAIRREKKPVFVDSGAFNAFKRAMREGDASKARLDFAPIFAKYSELSRRVCQDVPYRDRALLMVVAPDVIGDQVATLELIEKHADQVQAWLEAGHEVIVPFQRGPLNQREAYDRVAAALGGTDFVVGIPSAAAAMTASDLRELLSGDYLPDRLHILGAVSSHRMEERMEVIRECYVSDVPGVTCDANVMRSKLQELGGLSGGVKFDKIKEILSRVVPKQWGGSLEPVLAKAMLDEDDAQVGFFTAPVRHVDVFAQGWTPPTRAQAEAGEYFKPTVQWRGLTIRIENPAGSTRHWRGGATKMRYDYGYFEDTIGADGDELDVYLGPSLAFAPNVYIVRQRRHGDPAAGSWRRYDEDKVMAGFLSEKQARAAYLMHYDDPRFLGEVVTMPVDKFVEKVHAMGGKPGMLKALMFMTQVGNYMRNGHPVQGYQRHETRESTDPHAGIRAAHQRQRQALRDHFRQYGDGFELRHFDGKQWAVLMPDASHEGKYRYQVFDDRGLRAHYTYNRPEDALDGAYDAGFREHDPGAMERLAPVWAARFDDPEVQARASVSGEREDGDRTQS